jgi:hypothetical protein
MSLLALQSLERDKACAKRWLPSGAVESYGLITWWRPFEAPAVSDIGKLYRALQRLRSRPDMVVVRGTLIDPSATRMRRALNGDDANLQDGDRSWLCCDLDTLATDEGMRAELVADMPGGLQRVGAWARAQLPAWLRDVTCVARWSQSAGRDAFARAKLHLWFWLARPVCCASLAAWASDVPMLDPAVCRPVQPIYTSDPIVQDGWRGPDERVALVAGTADLGSPPPALLNIGDWTARKNVADREREENARRWAEADRYRTPAARASRAASRLHTVVRRALDEMATAPESRRHGTLMRAAAAIARTAQEVGVDPRSDLDALAQVAAARLPSGRAAEPAVAIEYAQRTL